MAFQGVDYSGLGKVADIATKIIEKKKNANTKETSVKDAVIPPSDTPINDYSDDYPKYWDLTDAMIQNFAKIKTLDFHYKPEIAEAIGDDKQHVGVSAQNLEENPITEGCVDETEDGKKIVDTRHLTAANTAVLSEVCKALIDITERLKRLEVEQ